jgi:hypothetical protein
LTYIIGNVPYASRKSLSLLRFSESLGILIAYTNSPIILSSFRNSVP